MNGKRNKITATSLVVGMVLSLLTPMNATNTIGMEQKKEYVVKIKVNEDVGRFRKNNKHRVKHRNGVKNETYLDNNNTVVLELTEAEAKSLLKEGCVERVEENVEVYALSDMEYYITTKDNDERVNVDLPELEGTEYTDPVEEFIPREPVTNREERNEVVPWNIDVISKNVYANEHKGENVRIAVIDSGIDVHDELRTSGWVDFSDAVSGYKPPDHSGHGTQMAGVIQSQDNGFGMVGLAPDAKVYSVKVLDGNNVTSVSNIIMALEWCLENEMDVVNMSFGMYGYSKILEDEIKKLSERGVIMIASAGNGGGKGVQYPAKFQEVIAVGAVNKKLEVSDFSAIGSEVELVAPGEEVQTTEYLGAYINASGTSVAAAHVTGAAAALKSLDENLSGQNVRRLLEQSARKLGEEERSSRYGYGLVSLDRAVEAYYNPGCDWSEPENGLEGYGYDANTDEENGFIVGSWSSSRWENLDYNNGTGHESLIDYLPYDLFKSPNEVSDYNEWIRHKWIVASAARFTDGNSMAPENKGSPYHAKIMYSLTTVKWEHSNFLYELARRRLVLNSNLSLDPKAYSGNNYYGVTIGESMKKRIISEMSELHNILKGYYGNVMDSIDHKGYMVLGVFFHLLQDTYCHRAGVFRNMIFSNVELTKGYSNMTYGNTYDNSKVKWDHINTSLLNKLRNALNSFVLPIICLKDYLYNNITILHPINGKEVNVKSSAAYEDNPFFYSDRFVISRQATLYMLNYIWQDTGAANGNYVWLNSNTVPLYSLPENIIW